MAASLTLAQVSAMRAYEVSGIAHDLGAPEG
jgi:hypothetical protein